MLEPASVSAGVGDEEERVGGGRGGDASREKMHYDEAIKEKFLAIRTRRRRLPRAAARSLYSLLPSAKDSVSGTPILSSISYLRERHHLRVRQREVEDVQVRE